MLNKHIENRIRENLVYAPTHGQEQLIGLLADFISNIDKKELLLVKGYAGTGKTTLLSAFVKTMEEMELKSVLLAPTGRAAKVFSRYAGKRAFTIHKKIYRQQSAKNGFGHFVLDRNLHRETIFIVDEASMISNQLLDQSVFGSGYLLDDLMEYVYNENNCKLILVGDTAQLPPVGLDISPALDRDVLEHFFINLHEVNLTDIVRQELDSGILRNATSIRQNIEKQEKDFPQLDITTPDVVRVEGNQLIEEILRAIDFFGIDETIVINRSNKRANKFNEGIRSQILWKEEEIAVGDMLMVVKNNYFWTEKMKEIDFIANGDIGEIIAIKKYHSLYNKRFADVVLRFNDYDQLELECKILLDTLAIESASLTSDQNKEFFYQVMEDYNDILNKKTKFNKIKEDPFYNALQVKFAYAVTCHKAQGGQWSAVFVDQGYVTEEMINTEYLRWLYTAFTRATKKIFLVNFDKKFFGEPPATK